MNDFDWNKLTHDTIPKVLVTLGIFFLAYDSIHHDGLTDGVLLAMISLLSMAAGYWLGSSAGSSKKTDILNEEEESKDT